MPKVLKKFEFTGGVGAESVYDWPLLLDGKVYEMIEGTDFTCKPATFSTLCRAASRKAGKTIKTQGNEAKTGIVIQAEVASKEQLKDWADADAAKKAKKAADKEAGVDETEETVEE